MATNKTIVMDANKKEVSLTYVQALAVARQILAEVTNEQLEKVSLSTKENVEIPMTEENFNQIMVKMALLSEKESKHNKPSSGTAKETDTQKEARLGCEYLMSKADPDKIYNLDEIRTLLDEGGHTWTGNQATRRMSDLYKAGQLTRYADGKCTVCLGVEMVDGKAVLDVKDLGKTDKGPVRYQFSVISE